MRSRILSFQMVVIAAFWIVAPAPAAEPKAPPNVHVVMDGRVFNDNPAHSWNRLHTALFARTTADGYLWGPDRIDPLLWSDSTYLLEGEPHTRALEALDAFLADREALAAADPVRRAVLQHDLWMVFDWLAEESRLKADAATLAHSAAAQALRLRVARAMKRLALTGAQIKALPNTLADAIAAKSFATAFEPGNPFRAFLPADLLASDGPWICLGTNSLATPLPAIHLSSFPTSSFAILVRHAKGRQAGLDYIDALNADSAKHPREREFPAPALPAGSQVALVRQILLIDSSGEVRPTTLTEKVQLRTLLETLAVPNHLTRLHQSAEQLELSRPLLFAKTAGGLRAAGPEENGLMFVRFFSKGVDEIQSDERHRGTFDSTQDRNVLRSCTGCHSEAHSELGAQFLVSAAGTFSNNRPAKIKASTLANENYSASIIKSRRFDTGVLKGIFQTLGDAP